MRDELEKKEESWGCQSSAVWDLLSVFFLNCSGHLCGASAGPLHLSSFPTFALQPNVLPPHRDAGFSEVSGLMIIKEMRLNQSARLVPLISVNRVRKTHWECYSDLADFFVYLVFRLDTLHSSIMIKYSFFNVKKFYTCSYFFLHLTF